jgi:endonuclease YncB( thermonuclease family)
MIRIALAAISLSYFPIACAETFTGRVIGVSDGDTLTILHVEADGKTPRKIRISGIDAPESKQAFGNRAKQAMSDLAYGKQADADCPTADRYGRDVCQVTVNGVDVGLALIQQGYAWHFKKVSAHASESGSFRLLRR